MIKIENELWEVMVNQTYEMEFDWVGMDKIGQVGIFSSFNRGFIPDCVKLSYSKYCDLADLINFLPEVTDSIKVNIGQGILTDWINFSKKGLFGFDYQDAHRVSKLNQYDLMTRPLKALKANELNALVDYKDIIPRFDFVFDNNISFDKMIKK